MKKSTIWLLAVVMGFSFAGLLFLQLKYVDIILKTRKEQFDTTVKNSLTRVSHQLEIDETRQFINEERTRNEYSFPYQDTQSTNIRSQITQQSGVQTINPDGSTSSQINIRNETIEFKAPSAGTVRQPSNIASTSRDIQNQYSTRYMYHGGLVDEVIHQMLSSTNYKPIEERIDFKTLNNYLKQELLNSGLNIPYTFWVKNKDQQVVYKSGEWEKEPLASEIMTQVLFPGDLPSRQSIMQIYFPTKKEYLNSSLSFFIPSVIFLSILLVTFTVTLLIIFRQKKLSEMKNDFINNMTHELKTPVSTISLASQMLKDTDITKSPDVFKHISGVIYDETKRLGFLVEKVLQMSLFEKQKAALKLKEIDANDLIVNIANTFALKVEKYGGTLDIDLEAIDSTIYVDEMHITNVLFNLMDNAVKYRRSDVPLELMVRTRNEGNKIIVSVEDNGIGVKKENLKKIFDRFYRIPTGNVHDVKGFGLGLAYVKKMVEDHNGTIRAENGANMIGTKFIISLPLINK